MENIKGKRKIKNIGMARVVNYILESFFSNLNKDKKPNQKEFIVAVMFFLSSLEDRIAYIQSLTKLELRNIGKFRSLTKIQKLVFLILYHL